MRPGDHLYLIDGSGYLFRAYHALPPLTRKSDGLPTGAVSGYCNMLWKLIADMKDGDNPTHLAVIFDAGKHTFRNDIYPKYKANRPPPPDDLIPQIPLVRDATRAFGVACVELAGYEADDLIATYARMAREAGARCTIVSSDKDLMQLVVDGEVQLFDGMKNKRIGSAEVMEKFGVPPSKVVDVQSLAGDSTDNVPGVPGIGIKTAAELINTFGDLESLLARAGEIKQPKRRETLQTNVEKARISQKLVRLDDRVAITEQPDGFIVREPVPADLVAFLTAMEFSALQIKVESTLQLSSNGETMDVQIDRYSYWREALKGNFGPVHDSDPQSGFYRKRKFRSGPFLPVAIWFDDASGAYVALVDGKADDAEAVWTYVCRYPVTEEAYRDRVAGKPWPDEDPGVTASLEAPATIGSNNPPKDPAVILAEQIDANCKSASAYAEIKDDETAGKAQSCRSRLLELGGQADKKREDEKRPHLDAGRAVDAKWQPIVKKAKDAAGAILRALNAHENRKLRQADRLRLPEPRPIQTQIRGGYGRAASKRMVKVVTVTDIDAAFGFLKSEQELVDLICRLAQRAVDAGNTVPGTAVKEEISCR